MSSYVFPELATYKKTWVPLLEAAKEWIEDCKVVYVCNALDFVAREYEEGTEVAAKAAEVAKEIEDLIALAIKGYCKTVTEWPPASHHSGRAEPSSELTDLLGSTTSSRGAKNEQLRFPRTCHLQA